jgi:hypothetical protein
MNWMKKGPELKLSELRIPDFLYDLYYDLKERHLLPLVALLLVAMVAAPIYFKGASKSSPEAPSHPSPTATASAAGAGAETLVVARSEPGLRDFRRRLSRDRAVDPFEEKGGESPAPSESSSGEEGASGAESSAATVAAPAEATVIGEKPSGSPAVAPIPPESAGIPSDPANSAGTGGPARTRYASDAIDVRIVSVSAGSTDKAGKPSKPKTQVRRNLPELTMLPARATPAATFMGTSSDGKKALLLVSSDVESLFGEAACVIGSQTCQLLALEPGLPETFVYGPQGRTYRIELLKIRQTLGNKPRRATLGAPKHEHPKQQHQTAGSEPAGRGGEEEAAAG